jgi:hypothetical protein
MHHRCRLIAQREITAHGSRDESNGSRDHGSRDHGSRDHGSRDHGSRDHGSRAITSSRANERRANERRANERRANERRANEQRLTAHEYFSVGHSALSRLRRLTAHVVRLTRCFSWLTGGGAGLISLTL